MLIDLVGWLFYHVFVKKFNYVVLIREELLPGEIGWISFVVFIGGIG